MGLATDLVMKEEAITQNNEEGAAFEELKSDLLFIKLLALCAPKYKAMIQLAGSKGGRALAA